jgi:hypothetical protein
MLERKPLSVAGKDVLETVGVASLTAKQWFLSSKDAVTNRNPVPNLKKKIESEHRKSMHGGQACSPVHG